MAPRSFNSLYILLELYALRTNDNILQILEREMTYLYTPMTDVKRRGLPGTRFVKMNSNLKEIEIDLFRQSVSLTLTLSLTLTAYLVWLHLVRR